jgi:hypothetical protein
MDRFEVVPFRFSFDKDVFFPPERLNVGKKGLQVKMVLQAGQWRFFHLNDSKTNWIRQILPHLEFSGRLPLMAGSLRKIKSLDGKSI